MYVVGVCDPFEFEEFPSVYNLYVCLSFILELKKSVYNSSVL
jgi:hypothetical protein